MTTFRISGVWKNDQGTITDYAVHSADDQRAQKTTKADAIILLEKMETQQQPGYGIIRVPAGMWEKMCV